MPKFVLRLEVSIDFPSQELVSKIVLKLEVFRSSAKTGQERATLPPGARVDWPVACTFYMPYGYNNLTVVSQRRSNSKSNTCSIILRPHNWEFQAREKS